MRLINADALKESLKKLKAEGTNRKYVQGLQDAIDDYFPQIIDDEPTIDDVKVIRHGKWFHDIEGYARCTVCNKNEMNEFAIFCTYCPNCGAIMDGGDSE
jgi:hypothetical protein